MWDKLGFRQNPYDTKPLQPSQSDVELLIGRKIESINFATALGFSNSGVAIISGVPGVGKTSFLNVQQFLLETGQSQIGPKILAARQLCPISATNTPGDIGIKALRSLVKSIDIFCELNDHSLPSETKKIKKWLNNPTEGGFDIGINLFGFGGNFGRTISVPPINEIAFENVVDIIEVIAEEICHKFSFSSVMICLDNIENLSEDNLQRILMTFRDTLFSLTKVWWILIGQTGLGSLIEALDPRISQRTTFTIELNPIAADELKIAIDKRIEKFHRENVGNSPVSEVIYQQLYNCSGGEIRFVFKYCSDICLSFIQSIHKEIASMESYEENTFYHILGKYLVNNQLKDQVALYHLKEIVKKGFDGLHLKQREKEVLSSIAGKKKIRPKDYKDLGFKTMQDFSSNYLIKLASQNLLLRKQEGRAVIYELRGLGALASKFNLI